MKKTLKRRAIVLGIAMSFAIFSLTVVTQSCNCDVKNDSSDKTEVPAAVKKMKDKDSKCGEGKCGEGKCGNKDSKEEKASESKCGEGKCGDGK